LAKAIIMECFRGAVPKNDRGKRGGNEKRARGGLNRNEGLIKVLMLGRLGRRKRKAQSPGEGKKWRGW